MGNIEHGRQPHLPEIALVRRNALSHTQVGEDIIHEVEVAATSINAAKLAGEANAHIHGARYLGVRKREEDPDGIGTYITTNLTEGNTSSSTVGLGGTEWRASWQPEGPQNTPLQHALRVAEAGRIASEQGKNKPTDSQTN
jgi:hypothetical protein